MKKISCFLIFIILSYFSFLSLQSFAANVELEKITVEAEGSGETKMSAMKDAWTNAVRKAIGMYIASSSKLKNDGFNEQMTEEIAAYSRGQVNSFETLSETQENGIWTIRIRANIDKEILHENVASSDSKTVNVDGANLAAQIQTASDKKNDAHKALEISDLLNFSKCLEYEPAIVTFKTEGKPVVFMRHVLKMNLKKYLLQVDELEKLVSQMSAKQCKIMLDQALAKNAMTLINAKDYKIDASILKRAEKYLDNSWFILTYPENGRSKSGEQNLHGVQPNLNSFNFSQINENNPMKGQASFSMTSKYHSDMPEWTRTESPWCFVKNTNSMTCYKVDSSLENLNFNNQYHLSFSISSPQISAMEGSKSFTLVLPPVLNSIITPYNNYFISPELFFGFDDGSKISSNDNSSAYFTPVFIFYQRIDLNPDELASIKQLTGKYELEPIERKMYPWH